MKQDNRGMDSLVTYVAIMVVLTVLLAPVINPVIFIVIILLSLAGALIFSK